MSELDMYDTQLTDDIALLQVLVDELKGDSLNESKIKTAQNKVDDILETGNTLSVLTRRLVKEGARRVYLCASHGLFSSSSMELIDLSPVEQVVVTDSIRLPPNASEKIAQVSVAPLLTQVIKTTMQLQELTVLNIN